jgi:cell division protein FtsI (penicillin-binding protein 3)
MGAGNIVKRRAAVLAAVITVGFAAVVFRLVDIMLLSHDRFQAKAKGQQTKSEIVPVKRGMIFDRRGRELAVNLDAESIYCDPAEIVSPEQTASAISVAMNKRPEAVLAKINSDKRFNWIERKIDIDKTIALKEMKLKGVGFIPEARRFYPKGSLASHVLGFVNIDNNGLEGIEQKYNRYLAVNQEKISVQRDAKGNVLSEGTNREIKGDSLVLTIDEGLQYIAEKNLDEAMSRWQASSATIIMMNPYNGEVLAMASRPSYDPNNPAEAKPQQRRNRAITDLYEPGSTFKIVTGAAALQEKAVTLDKKFDCSAGYIEVGGRKIKDAHKHGVLTFKEVIQKSSNVGTIKVALGLGKGKLYEYIRKFGFGDKTGIDLMGEVSGLVRPPDRWSGMSIGAIAIGQEIAVTPLQVLRAYSVIANGGFLVKPHIVSKIISPDGKLIHSTSETAQRILSEETATVFRGVLKTVTEEGGTATQAAVDGNQVAGKTGTAQLFDHKTKRYSTTNYISSFVGFVPADSPQIAMIVVIQEPRGQIYGGVVAGPVFKKIANESLSYLRVPRDDSNEKGLIMVSTK